MLCFPGFTPVAKVDQATGESGGSVLLKGQKEPSFGAYRNWGAPLGPSSLRSECSPFRRTPRRITRRNRLLLRLLRRLTLHQARGQGYQVEGAKKKARKTRKKEPRKRTRPRSYVGAEKRGKRREKNARERRRAEGGEGRSLRATSLLEISVNPPLPLGTASLAAASVTLGWSIPGTSS